MKIGFSLVVGLLFLTLVSFNQNDELKESIARGKTVYVENCISCHLVDGKGVPTIFPPLAKSDFLTDSIPEAIKAVKYGLQGAIKVNGEEYDNMMPEPGLDDREVSDVMNYILNTWGNSTAKMVTVKQVQETKPNE